MIPAAIGPTKGMNFKIDFTMFKETNTKILAGPKASAKLNIAKLATATRVKNFKLNILKEKIDFNKCRSS